MPRRIRAFSLLGVALLVVSSLAPHSLGDTLQSTDFQKQSFSKVVDWFDYVRQYAAANGFNATVYASDHAYIYTNYINVNGFQLFYVGLVNATHNGYNVTVPLQTFFEHYKTQAGKTVITASSFISIVAFNETSSTTIHPNSPDKNDTVYASFSLGIDLSSLFGQRVPSYVAASQIIPLTSKSDGTHWSWGLKYTNLNAIWWKIGLDPISAYWYTPLRWGLARYSELTFNYDLTIDSSTKTAKLVTTYTVGRVTDLWLLTPLPVRHLNATGTYSLDGNTQISSQTVYQYLQAGKYQLSIVLANKAIVASHTSSDKDDSGASVDDNEADVTHTGVNTSADDGERLFRADFGVKYAYKLYDISETAYTSYNVTTRTVRRSGWGGNPVFAFQSKFMGLLPLFVVHVDPGLVQQAKSGLISFAVSDYVYIISYPQWGGTRVVHDPDYTAFFQPSGRLGLLTTLFVVVAVAAGIGGVFAYIFRRRKTTNVALTGAPGQTSPQGPTAPGPAAPGP